MSRISPETDRSQLFRSLFIVGAVGAAALVGVVYEAAHGNIPGAVAFTGVGAAGMSAAGIAIEKSHN